MKDLVHKDAWSGVGHRQIALHMPGLCRVMTGADSGGRLLFQASPKIFNRAFAPLPFFLFVDPSLNDLATNAGFPPRARMENARDFPARAKFCILQNRDVGTQILDFMLLTVKHITFLI